MNKNICFIYDGFTTEIDISEEHERLIIMIGKINFDKKVVEGVTNLDQVTGFNNQKTLNFKTTLNELTIAPVLFKFESMIRKVVDAYNHDEELVFKHLEVSDIFEVFRMLVKIEEAKQ